MSWREKVTFQGNDDHVHFVPDQHAWLNFIVLAHCPQFHICHDSEPTSLCAYSLKLHTQHRSNKPILQSSV